MTPGFIPSTVCDRCVLARTVNQADKGIIQFRNRLTEGATLPAEVFADRNARAPG
jgi:hypothetical protein